MLASSTTRLSGPSLRRSMSSATFAFVCDLERVRDRRKVRIVVAEQLGGSTVSSIWARPQSWQKTSVERVAGLGPRELVRGEQAVRERR